MAATSGAMRVPSEPLIITTSPARTAPSRAGSSSAEDGAQAPLLRRRKLVEQEPHHRATGKNQIDTGRVNRFLQAAMEARRRLAQLQHVAQHGNAAAERSRAG